MHASYFRLDRGTSGASRGLQNSIVSNPQSATPFRSIDHSDGFSAEQPAFADDVRKHRRAPLLNRPLRVTVVTTGGRLCRPEVTGENLTAEAVFSRCLLRSCASFALATRQSAIL